MSITGIIDKDVIYLERDLGVRLSEEEFRKVKLAIASAALAGSIDSDYAKEAARTCEELENNG